MTHPSSRGLLGARDLALVAVFVGIVAAFGLVPAFQPTGLAVPITLQSMGVMLAGSILGARRGGLSLLVFVLLVAAGLPLLAGQVGGLGMFTTPRAGFIVGFPVAAFVTGLLASAAARPGREYDVRWGFVANVLGGVVALYACGLLGVMRFAHLPVDEAFTALWVFVPGDVVKAVVATVVAAGVHRGYPGLLVRERDEQPEPAAV
jgi:biotin transport system substrate-specific component